MHDLAAKYRMLIVPSLRHIESTHDIFVALKRKQTCQVNKGVILSYSACIYSPVTLDQAFLKPFSQLSFFFIFP